MIITKDSVLEAVGEYITGKYVTDADIMLLRKNPGKFERLYNYMVDRYEKEYGILARYL